MLVLLPPSEGKIAPPRRGRPVDLAGLSFPELTPIRERLLDGLAATSARPDALALLGVPQGAAAEVAGNLTLRATPARPVGEVYDGVLYAALDGASLAPSAKRWAARWLVVTSALWGAVRWTDRIPPYRMNACARLPGTEEHLEPMWRAALDPVLAEAAGGSPILDCRSSSYVALWRPRGPLAEQWVRVEVHAPGGARISHHAKHTRGLVVRALLSADRVAKRVRDLPSVLSGFEVELTEPVRPGAGWVLDVAQA